jgi:hypothetical protein
MDALRRSSDAAVKQLTETLERDAERSASEIAHWKGRASSMETAHAKSSAGVWAVLAGLCVYHRASPHSRSLLFSSVRGTYLFSKLILDAVLWQSGSQRT